MASPEAKSPSGQFDFEDWSRSNDIHGRIVDFLRQEGLVTPRLLFRLSEEDKVMLSAEGGVQQGDIEKLEAAIDQLFHEGHRKSSAGFPRTPTHPFALEKIRSHSESHEQQEGSVKTKATTLPAKQHSDDAKPLQAMAAAFDRGVVVRKTFPPLDNKNRPSLRPEATSRSKQSASPMTTTGKSSRPRLGLPSSSEGRVERMRALFSKSTENTTFSQLSTPAELQRHPLDVSKESEASNGLRKKVLEKDYVSKRFPHLSDESTKRYSLPLERTFQENRSPDKPRVSFAVQPDDPKSLTPSRLGYSAVKSESDITRPQASLMTSAIPEEYQSHLYKNVPSDWLYDYPRQGRVDHFRRDDTYRKSLPPLPTSSSKEDLLQIRSKHAVGIDEEVDEADSPTLHTNDMALTKELETEWFQRAHLLRSTCPMPASSPKVGRESREPQSLISKPFDHWSPSDVRHYFEADPQEDIRHHAGLFEEYSVSGWDLVSQDDLDGFLKTELKIANAGHRRKIQRRITTLQRRQVLRTGAVPSPVAEPKNLKIVYNDGRKVTATWKPPRHKIDGYTVTITELYEPYTELVMQRLHHHDQTSITCEGLQPETHYVIRVVALCGDEESEPVSQPFRTSEELVGDASPATVKRTASITNPSHYMTPAPLYHVYQTERIPILVKSDTQGPPTLTWMSSSTPTWDKFPQVIQSGIKYRLTPKQRQLQEAMFEVLSSEESFIKSMYVLGEHFLRNLEKKNVAGGQALTLISVHVAHVINASRAFLSDLQARMREQAPVVTDVCDIILRHASKRFQEPYVTYCRNMYYHSKALIGLMESDKPFCDDVRQLENDPRCGKLAMTAFLLTPMQRVTRFPLLVERILTCRDVTSAYFEVAEQALQTTKALAVKCNQAAYKEQQAMELEELVVNKLRLAKCKPPFSLLDKSRWVVKQGELILVRDKGPNTHRYVILLSDCFLLAKKLNKRSSETTYELVNYCMRNRLDVEEVNKIYDDSEKTSSSDRSEGGKGIFGFLHGLYLFKPKPTNKLRVTLHEDSSGQHQEMVFSLKTESELTRWVEALQYSAADPQGGKVYPDWDCPMTVVTKSRNAAQPDELSLERGDIVRVLRKMPDGMWHGETIHDARQGWFPNICVEEIRDSDHYKAKQLRQKHGSGREKGVKEYTYVALFDLEPEIPTALRLHKDQKVEILDFRDGEWYQARLLDTLEVGLVPAGYVAPMDDLQREEWYLGSMDRKDADALLRSPGCAVGTYLVRETHNAKGSHVYTISVKTQDKEGREVIRRFKVERTKHNKLRVNKESGFDSLQELMRDLIEKGSIAGCPLDKPCPKPKPQINDFKGRWEVSRERIKLGKKLGQGQFGDVVEGFWTGDTEETPVKVAVKTMRNGSTATTTFLQEAEMMMRLYHPNLVQLYGVCSEKDPVLIITEFMANGSLEKYLRHGQGSSFTLMELVSIAIQVADGMAYLEDNNIVHRDLRAANVLVADGMAYLEDNNIVHRDLRAANVLVGDNNVCKVADFGLARIDHYKASSAQFPIRWTAIESIQTHEFTVQSDVWSFGILMAEILSKGKVPYMGWDNTQVLQRVMQGYRMPKESSWPEQLYHHMRRCWDKEPSKRPSFSSLRETLRDFLMNTTD